MTHHTELYRLDRGASPSDFIIKKFDADLNLKSEWHMARAGRDCSCWQHKTWCRHKQMLKEHFIPSGHIGDGWFLDRGTHEWLPPIGDSHD